MFILSHECWENINFVDVKHQWFLPMLLLALFPALALNLVLVPVSLVSSPLLKPSHYPPLNCTHPNVLRSFKSLVFINLKKMFFQISLSPLKLPHYPPWTARTPVGEKQQLQQHMACLDNVHVHVTEKNEREGNETTHMAINKLASSVDTIAIS